MDREGEAGWCRSAVQEPAQPRPDTLGDRLQSVPDRPGGRARAVDQLLGHQVARAAAVLWLLEEKSPSPAAAVADPPLSAAAIEVLRLLDE